MLKQSSSQTSVEGDVDMDESDQNDHISKEEDAHMDESDQNNIVLFYVLFTKLEHMAHFKAKNKNTVKLLPACMPETSN